MDNIGWELSVFEKSGEKHLRSIYADQVDLSELIRVFGTDASSMIDGEWMVENQHAADIEKLFGEKLDFDSCEYFVGARAK